MQCHQRVAHKGNLKNEDNLNMIKTTYKKKDNHGIKNEDHLKNEDNLENYAIIKNKDNLKNEDDLKNEEDVISKTGHSPSYYDPSPYFSFNIILVLSGSVWLFDICINELFDHLVAFPLWFLF